MWLWLELGFEFGLGLGFEFGLGLGFGFGFGLGFGAQRAASPQVTSSASSREPARRAREPRPRRRAVSHEGR